MTRVILEPETELDLFEAALWYESERRGLGAEFEAEFHRVQLRIQQNPFQFPKIESGVRRALLRRFPSSVPKA